MKDFYKNQELNIICILGYDRSGTTLIGKLFSKFDDVEYFGELDNAYYHLFKNHDRVCSCGKEIYECEIWKNVIVDSDTKISEFYRQLKDYSNANFLIDSSKRIEHLKKLQGEITELITFIHIIRNPKGVAYSRMKTRKRRVAKGNHPKIYLAKRTNLMMIYDCLEWSVRNFKIESFKKNKSSFKTIYYEELEQDFAKMTKELLGEERSFETLYNYDKKINHHVLYGNINRFKQVNLPIKTDVSWENGLKGFQKILIDILTFPTRSLFNYKF